MNTYENQVVNRQEHLAVTQAGHRGLAEMRRRYGSGYPLYKPGEEATYYMHGEDHGISVGRNGGRLAEYIGLPRAYVVLSTAAGEAHDAILTDGKGNKLPRGDMERQTAAFFTSLVIELGGPRDVAVEGGLIIEGTKPVFDESGKVVGQAATTMEYPNRECREAALGLATADLADVLSAKGPRGAYAWYREDRGISPGDVAVFDPKELESYAEVQTGFAADLRLAHPKGDKLFGALRSRVVAFHEGVLQGLQSGRIDSWPILDQMIADFEAMHT